MTSAKRYRDTADIIGWARRAIRGAGNCVAKRGLETGDDLGDLASLARTLDEALVEAVRGCRAHGHSWQQVADSLGVTRQTAHAKYASVIESPAMARQTLAS